jgi:hypothetical protein
LKTINKGETWDTLKIINFPLYSAYFTDNNTGFAVGREGTIMKTTDAGMSWNPVSTCTKYSLRAICFSDAQTGNCAGANGTIFQTTNAGTGFPTGSIGESNLIVYLNPGKNLISIELSVLGKDSRETITLFSITGQSLIKKEMQGEKITLDITSLLTGILCNVCLTGVHKNCEIY